MTDARHPPWPGAGDPARQLHDTALGATPGRSRMAGRKVLVVGAGQRNADVPAGLLGNGRAISLLLAREGASLICADADLSAADATAGLIRAEHGSAEALELDLRDAASIGLRTAHAAQMLQGLDGVVLNVGISTPHDLPSTTAEAWDDVMAVNLRGNMLVAQAALRSLAPGASMVFVSSIAATSPASRYPSYEVSKAGVAALARAVALEGQAQGIRANVVVLGLIDTPLGRYASALKPGRIQRPLPFGRQGTAWEVAQAVLFLLSHESSFVNAHQLVVDGGMTAGVCLPAPLQAPSPAP